MYLCSVCGATNPKDDKCFATPPTALPPDISAVYESVNRHQVANASSAGPPVRPVAHLCLDGRIKDVPSARCKASHTRDCDLVYINEVDRLLAGAVRAEREGIKRDLAELTWGEKSKTRNAQMERVFDVITTHERKECPHFERARSRDGG